MKPKNMIFKCVLLTFVGTILLSSHVNAALIYSPTSILQNTAGNFVAGSEVENAFNGSGLTSGFSSGVTDFDTYIGSNPLHTTTFSGFEWFSQRAGFVDLDMGSVLSLTRLAIWNEEGGNGVGILQIFSATDNTFSSLTGLGVFNPNQNLGVGDYGAQILDFTDASAQFLRLQFTGNRGGVFGLGEIVFAADGVSNPVPVPAPATLALFGLGLAGLGWSRRKKV